VNDVNKTSTFGDERLPNTETDMRRGSGAGPGVDGTTPCIPPQDEFTTHRSRWCWKWRYPVWSRASPSGAAAAAKGLHQRRRRGRAQDHVPRGQTDAILFSRPEVAP